MGPRSLAGHRGQEHPRAMATHDVLLIESRPGIAEQTARDLAAAGHRVHRCHEQGMPAFPCTALTQPGSCPLDGHVDVALLVRSRVQPRPTQAEDGVSCAIRAGIPLVEQGTSTLDPFDPWVTRRISSANEVEAALDEAVDMADGPLRRDITARIRPLLERALLSAYDATIRIQ